MVSFLVLVKTLIISKVSVLSVMTRGHVLSASGAGVFCIWTGLAQSVLFLPSNPAQLFTLCEWAKLCRGNFAKHSKAEPGENACIEFQMSTWNWMELSRLSVWVYSMHWWERCHDQHKTQHAYRTYQTESFQSSFHVLSGGTRGKTNWWWIWSAPCLAPDLFFVWISFKSCCVCWFLRGMALRLSVSEP